MDRLKDRITKEHIRPGAKFVGMQYNNTIGVLDRVIELAYPKLPSLWIARFAQPVPPFIQHKYFEKRKNSQGIVELTNPRIENQVANRRIVSTITNLELELTEPLRLETEEHFGIDPVLTFTLSGEVHFNGRVTGISSSSFTLASSETDSELDIRFSKLPPRLAIPKVSDEWLETMGQSLDVNYAQERANRERSARVAQQLASQRVNRPFNGGLPGSNRSH